MKIGNTGLRFYSVLTGCCCPLAADFQCRRFCCAEKHSPFGGIQLGRSPLKTENFEAACVSIAEKIGVRRPVIRSALHGFLTQFATRFAESRFCVLVNNDHLCYMSISEDFSEK